MRIAPTDELPEPTFGDSVKSYIHYWKEVFAETPNDDRLAARLLRFADTSLGSRINQWHIEQDAFLRIV